MKALTLVFTTVVLVLLPAACARRMTVSTGTTIGLNATPGDGKSQSPQVTLAYKRAELALVPTGEKAAKKEDGNNSDAYSALAIIDFRTKWFTGTSIDQFIATGHASRDIQAADSAFPTEMLHMAKSETATRLQQWVKRAPDLAERKRRQQVMKDWIGNGGYSFADLLYSPKRETERTNFLNAKATAEHIP